MIIGIHTRDNDLVVNPLKGKKLTNIRAAGKDENTILVTPRTHDIESALEYVDADELVEITPDSVRLRKRILDKNKRPKRREID
jgi:GTP-binding protein